MQRLFKLFIALIAVALVSAPQFARADGYVSPWVGSQFGSDVADGRASFGVDVGAMGKGIFGGEVDFGYSPSFFGTENDFGHNTVLDLMGNLIIGAPFGGTRGKGFRPYATGGVGLIRTQIDGGTVFNVSSSNNRFGWDAGGGVMGFFNDHVGLRGDMRYLRYWGGNVENGLDLGTLHFWRISGGLVIR